MRRGLGPGPACLTSSDSIGAGLTAAARAVVDALRFARRRWSRWDRTPRQCLACGRLNDAAGYLSPPAGLAPVNHGMCPPCADSAFAAERDRLAAERRTELAAEWEAGRLRLRAASPHWFP